MASAYENHLKNLWTLLLNSNPSCQALQISLYLCNECNGIGISKLFFQTIQNQERNLSSNLTWRTNVSKAKKSLDKAEKWLIVKTYFYFIIQLKSLLNLVTANVTYVLVYLREFFQLTPFGSMIITHPKSQLGFTITSVT